MKKRNKISLVLLTLVLVAYEVAFWILSYGRLRIIPQSEPVSVEYDYYFGPYSWFEPVAEQMSKNVFYPRLLIPFGKQMISPKLAVSGGRVFTSLLDGGWDDVTDLFSTDFEDIPLSRIVLETDVPSIWRYNTALILELEMHKQDPWMWWLPTPDGFNISPNKADFIHSRLSNRTGSSNHHGIYRGTRALCFDTNTYYALSEANPWIDPTPIEIENATRINGLDGTVFNKASSQWEHVGYIHMTYDEVMTKLPRGTSVDKVCVTLGPPHTRRDWSDNHPHDLGGEGREALEYFIIREDRRGSMLIIIEDDKVVGYRPISYMRL